MSARRQTPHSSSHTGGGGDGGGREGGVGGMLGSNLCRCLYHKNQRRSPKHLLQQTVVWAESHRSTIIFLLSSGGCDTFLCSVMLIITSVNSQCWSRDSLLFIFYCGKVLKVGGQKLLPGDIR